MTLKKKFRKKGKTMEQKIRWGVLGCAGIAEQRTLPGLLKAGNAELTAIASRGKSEKLERFRSEFRPERTYESYEVLLEDPEVEAVYLPLPNGLHCDWAVRALEAGKHVLCEKPLGISRREVERMKAASEKSGKLLMEAFAYRQSPQTKRVKEIVDSGAIGPVRFLVSGYCIRLENREDVRYSKELAGGATYDVGCYNVNLIRTLAGCEPEQIKAAGEIGESGVDLGSTVAMRFPNGAEAVFYCGFGSCQDFGYRVVGERGTIRVDDEFNSKGLTGISVMTAGETQRIGIDCPDNYMLEIEQFGRAVRGEEKPLVSLEDSLGNAAVIDEILRQVFGRR